VRDAKRPLDDYCVALPGPGWSFYDSSEDGLTTMPTSNLILFLPRSGFGVYSIDSHVSIEKYNILWLKGIA